MLLQNDKQVLIGCGFIIIFILLFFFYCLENFMNKLWIGLFYEQGDWRWFKTREPANYTNWEQGEPQVWDRCAMYAKSLGTFVWRGSYQCSWKPFYNFICEKGLYHFYH